MILLLVLIWYYLCGATIVVSLMPHHHLCAYMPSCKMPSPLLLLPWWCHCCWCLDAAAVMMPPLSLSLPLCYRCHYHDVTTQPLPLLWCLRCRKAAAMMLPLTLAWCHLRCHYRWYDAATDADMMPPPLSLWYCCYRWHDAAASIMMLLLPASRCCCYNTTAAAADALMLPLLSCFYEWE